MAKCSLRRRFRRHQQVVVPPMGIWTRCLFTKANYETWRRFK